MSAVLLAIDTSTSWAGIALYDGGPLFELNWRAERRHSQQVMSTIERALEMAGVERSDLGAVGVARGPGSYTGVRVGITLARVLGMALGVPAVGVDSLEILAWPHRRVGLPVRVLLDAGRRRYATSLYRPGEVSLERVGALQSVDDDMVVDLVTERTVLCGELRETTLERLREQAGDLVLLPDPAEQVRRAAVLAELAWRRWRAGSEDALVTDPIYVSQEQG